MDVLASATHIGHPTLGFDVPLGGSKAVSKKLEPVDSEKERVGEVVLHPFALEDR